LPTIRKAFFMKCAFGTRASEIAVVLLLHVGVGLSPLSAAPQRPLRVAVVGAGPAGLTAARTLTDLGHEVVVFEKESRVGGKVLSIPFGDKSLEFGAVLVTEDDYPITLGYADEFGIATVPAPAGFIRDENGNKVAVQDYLRSRYTAAEIAAAEQNYAAVLDRFAAFIAAPGMVALPADLTLPFDEFAECYGIQLVEDWMKALLTGFGYGYSATVPAAYYVKFLPFLLKLGPAGFEAESGRIFPTGFQSVFDALAATLDVRLDSEVTRIRRPPPGCADCPVLVTVNGTQQRAFDAVVIATPLNVVPSFLDVTPGEAWLFSRVRSARYFVTLFLALGVDQQQVVYFQENAAPERIDHVGVWAVPYDTGVLALGNAYQIAERGISPWDVQSVLAQDMWQAGGWFLGALYQQEWRNYFPHVGAPLLALGFYDAIDRMQGRRATYFVGSSLTFETVEHAARQARDLVLTRIGRAGAPAPVR
jgi:protoporphyrinogen/coproporphyrinogen III oxidase